jgi:NAD(P)-dependent dehydrogenase (short-subunit alcohol dehydrogenase family)
LLAPRQTYLSQRGICKHKLTPPQLLKLASLNDAHPAALCVEVETRRLLEEFISAGIYTNQPTGREAIQKALCVSDPISVPITPCSDFDQLLNIHFKGTFFLTQKLLPLLKDGGRIVNLSSGLARFSMPGYSAYAAMKGAIEVLSRYMAKELGGRKIAVNVIAPGAIETDFWGGAVRDNKQINAMIASSTSLGRVGLPDDIGGAVASLLSDDNGWVNGQGVEVSGGIFL